MIYLNIGRRELGKSTLALFMARRCPRVIIVDPRHLYGFTGTPAVGDLPDDLQTLTDRWSDGDSAIVIQPDDRIGETMAELAGFLRVQFARDRSLHVAVILDEAALLDLSAWAYLFRCAPRENLIVILTAHRPKDIPTTVRALSDVWCLFRMTQEHDLEVIEERCGPEVARIVTTLQPYQFASWNDARGVLTVYRDPAAWYTDMGRSSSGVTVDVETLPPGEEIDPAKKTRLF